MYDTTKNITKLSKFQTENTNGTVYFYINLSISDMLVAGLHNYE